jgi:hypothetical protein
MSTFAVQCRQSHTFDGMFTESAKKSMHRRERRDRDETCPLMGTQRRTLNEKRLLYKVCEADASQDNACQQINESTCVELATMSQLRT